ncbi:hypothetical protein SDC9_195434 [bioreactor metagenome]|uniref:Uncharacterized protein n=1 Tax=bioreactor metagenome TaxID=1076179 RepID=A0A645I9Q3_9ZZZZ
MTKMRIAGPAHDFRPLHPVAVIGFLNNDIRIKRLAETRPAAAAGKFIRGGKKRFAGYDIDIETFFMILIIRISERTFRRFLLGNGIL